MRLLNRTFSGCDEPTPVRLDTSTGQCRFSSVPGDGEGAENEDAVGVWELAPDTLVLALADGMGGGPAGGEASALALACLDRRLKRWKPGGGLRASILDAFESANEQLRAESRGSGASSTALTNSCAA